MEVKKKITVSISDTERRSLRKLLSLSKDKLEDLRSKQEFKEYTSEELKDLNVYASEFLDYL